jgi:general L-amino acid transport system permease protein
LAIAIAFADIFQVSVTIMNQSGQSVSGITMIMLTYLSISLIIASFTNLANRRFQLVTR